jgi:hypothetical protein
VQEFRENDLLHVIYHDRSRDWGCLKGTDADGFLLSFSDAPAQRVLYGEVATVERQSRGRFGSIKAGVLRVGSVAAVWFGVAKIGGDSPPINGWLGIKAQVDITSQGDGPPEHDRHVRRAPREEA